MTEARPHGIRTRVVLGALGVLALVIVLVGGAVHMFAMHFRIALEGPNAPPDLRIAPPVLQSAPREDTGRYLEHARERLQSYAWVDREKGIARIPIEDAMRILAGAKEPSAAPGPYEAGERSSPRTATPQARTSAEALARAEVVQHVGASLPLDARFSDETGAERPLSAYFGREPVVLVFGYYRCATMCTTMMEGVLMALAATGLAPDAYEVLGVTIDPRETPLDAAGKARAYHAAYEGVRLHLLTGRADAIARLARAAGVRYAYDTAANQYAHPLALVVVAPDGKIARYMPGVRFGPPVLKLALIEAGEGRLGTLSERLFLRCAHFDPRTGRYSLAAWTFVRAGALIVIAALLAWAWRRRGAGRVHGL
jgi:protein SCO1/2